MGEPKLVRGICRAVRDAASRHRKAGVIFLLGLCAWLTMIICLWLFPSAIPHVRPWLEMANGATWSDKWETMSETHRLWFAVTVGTRTAINFAGPLAVIGGVVWFFLGGLERYMQMSLLEQIKMHNVELVSRLGLILAKRHPGVIDTADIDAMQAEAKLFLNDFKSELKGIAEVERQ